MDQPQPPSDQPNDFAPLNLILKPTGLTISVSRGDNLVGRHSEADIRLPLPDVSRRHCRLIYTSGGWHVMDLNSLNGVYVNGDRCNETDLHQHDELRIGGFTFVVDLVSSDVTDDPDPTNGVVHRMEDYPHRRAS